MTRYFASNDEICRATTAVDIDAAIRCLNQGGILQQAREYCPMGGPVVYCGNHGVEQVVGDDSHSITFASTGRGKTRRYIYPTVMSDILSGTNIVVNDMKGEIYATTKDLLRLADYKVYVLDLRDPAHSPDRFNPLDVAWLEWHAGNDDAAFMYLRSFACAVFQSRNVRGVDPFWANTAVDYFVGLTLGMLEGGVSRKAFTLESVARMDLMGERIYERRLNSEVSYLQHFFGFFPSDSIALQNVSGTLNAPDRTRQSIASVFRQPMSIYAGQRGLMDVLCHSDFSIEDLSRERTAFFIISPDETHALGPIVVGVLNQLMSGLITLAQNKHDGTLPNRVDFVLDEMGNLPARIPDLDALVSAARSRNIRFHFVLQSADQLTNVYGEELKNVIMDNCDTWVFMGSRGLPFLRQISELAGTVVLETGQERPLISVDKLQHLETRETESEALVFVSSLRPYVAALKDVGQYEKPKEVLDRVDVQKQVIQHEVFDITAATKSDIRRPPSAIKATAQPSASEIADNDNANNDVNASVLRDLRDLLSQSGEGASYHRVTS